MLDEIQGSFALNDMLYWVWLQCALGISPALRTQEICAAFSGGAKEIHAASDYERRLAGVFTNLQLSRLRATPLAQAETILEECARTGTHILSPQALDYPARLLQIVNFPLALYVRGNLSCLRDHLGLAIVGTRRASRKSVDIAARLSADLVQAGCVIVSGGALGIDSAAHWGALHAKGYTCAVLGCGLSFNYLPENAAMREKIAAQGAVVTEYPGGTAPIGRNFPIRNRLISGMTAGTVVIEANEKSGSLITANCAAEQGRDVFAVPGDAFGSTYTGGNMLIREGAKPVFSAMDVLEDYELLYPELLDMRRAQRDLSRAAVNPEQVPVGKPKTPQKPKPAPPESSFPAPEPPPQPAPLQPTPELPALEQNIVRLLHGGAMHVDRIMQETGEGFGPLFAALMNLEIQGMVEQEPGKLYSLRHAFQTMSP